MTALAKKYALKIKALKEEQEAEIEKLYVEFHERYQCLKRQLITEDQDGETSADSLSGSNASPPTEDSLAKSVHTYYEPN